MTAPTSNAGAGMMAVDELKTAILENRCVILPCKLGDTLWIVSENDDTGETEIFPSPPVKAIAVLPGGKFGALTYDENILDVIGGPVLYLTKTEALLEQARRIAEKGKGKKKPGKRKHK